MKDLMKAGIKRGRMESVNEGKKKGSKRRRKGLQE